MISKVQGFFYNSIDNIKVENKQSNLGLINSKIRDLCTSLLTPNDEATWASALMKTGIGFTGMYSVDDYNTTYINQSVEVISTGFFITGIKEIIYIAYANLAHKPYLVNSIKKSTLKFKTLNEMNSDLSKLIKIVKIITLTGLSLHCLYNYDSLGNLDFFDDNKFSAENAKFLNPTTDSKLQLAQIILCVSSIAINFKSLSHVQEKSFLKSSPIDEIIHACIFATFFSQINNIQIPEYFIKCAQPFWNCLTKSERRCFHYIAPCFEPFSKNQKIELITFYQKKLIRFLRILNPDSPRPFEMKSGDLHLHYLKRYTKYYALLIQAKDIFSLAKSGVESWMQIPTLAKTNVGSFNPSVQIENEPLNAPSPVSCSLELPKIELDENFPISHCHSLQIKQEIPGLGKTLEVTKSKKKTKGIPHQGSFNKGNTKEKPNLKATNPHYLDSQTKERENNFDRKAALDRIKKLKAQKGPIKSQIILAELEKAANFLNGKIVPVGGSVFRLEWLIDKTRFSLSFEIPHGIDNTNFRGNKLNRVIKVLQTAYLIGLSYEAAINYIEKYNLYNLYRCDKFIYYILSKRSRKDYSVDQQMHPEV